MRVHSNDKFKSHQTPVSGPKPGASMVGTDINGGMRAHESNPLAWDSATDAFHNSHFGVEYKPIQRGKFF